MQELINFFTVSPTSSMVYTLVFGVIFMVMGLVNEVLCVIQRFLYLCNPRLRHMFTWTTGMWLPVRLLVIITLPQALYQLFFVVLELG